MTFLKGLNAIAKKPKLIKKKKSPHSNRRTPEDNARIALLLKTHEVLEVAKLTGFSSPTIYNIRSTMDDFAGHAREGDKNTRREKLLAYLIENGSMRPCDFKKYIAPELSHSTFYRDITALQKKHNIKSTITAHRRSCYEYLGEKECSTD